jgi:hypothetical protein
MASCAAPAVSDTVRDRPTAPWTDQEVPSRSPSHWPAATLSSPRACRSVTKPPRNGVSPSGPRTKRPSTPARPTCRSRPSTVTSLWCTERLSRYPTVCAPYARTPDRTRTPNLECSNRSAGSTATSPPVPVPPLSGSRYPYPSTDRSSPARTGPKATPPALLRRHGQPRRVLPRRYRYTQRDAGPAGRARRVGQPRHHGVGKRLQRFVAGAAGAQVQRGRLRGRVLQR